MKRNRIFCALLSAAFTFALMAGCGQAETPAPSAGGTGEETGKHITVNTKRQLYAAGFPADKESQML